MANVLVVEDDAQISKVIKYLLESSGHKVEEAIDAVQGLKYVDINPPDLIITDLYLPRMDGFELIRELRRRGFGGSIIACSGEIPTPGCPLQAALEAGATDTLTKPFDVKDFLARVQEQVG